MLKRSRTEMRRSFLISIPQTIFEAAKVKPKNVNVIESPKIRPKGPKRFLCHVLNRKMEIKGKAQGLRRVKMPAR